MIGINVFDQRKYDVSVYGAKYVDGNNYYVNTVEEWARITKADYVFNLGFFNNAEENKARNCYGRSLQYIFNPHIGDIGYDDKDGGRTPIITLESGSKFRGYGVIVADNRIQNGLYWNFTARNFNGITEDGRYIHVISSSCTEYQVAYKVITDIRKLYNTSVKYLFREDGGGSASEYSSLSKLAYYPQGVRRIPTVVCIKQKEAYVFNRVIHKGMSGGDVKELQKILGGLEVDGIAGAATDKRIKQAQSALGIGVDGWAGQQTYIALKQKYLIAPPK